jgi:hypothetical protein
VTILGAETVTVTRRSGSYVNGVFAPVLDSSFDWVASIQPAPGRAIEQLPEAARTRAMFVAYADIDQAELRTVEVSGSGLPDRIIRGGRVYEVHRADDWSSHVSGVPHHSYLLVEVGGDEQ